MLTRDFFSRYRVLPSPFWERNVGGLYSALETLNGTRVRFEGLESLPGSPALIATNSTQKYDFMPIRSELRRRGVPTVTVTKGKNYHSAPMRFLLSRLGVVPLASRGYLILVDFTSVHGRRPTDEEYRAIRQHVDNCAPLPDSAVFKALRTRARDLLGFEFAPARESFRDALRRIYREVMSETVRLSQEAVRAGAHVQMYPEGTVSSRLGEGRIGAVQLAWALKVPIVPCGMSGCRGALRGQTPLPGPGEVVVRFGSPYQLPADLLPGDFEPFSPDHEAAHRDVLRAATRDLMAKIDPLLDEPCRRQEGFVADGTRGTRRFL